ncbi:hemolysin family protein [Corynebacterium halotolerans]|uniref:hemolysin family protein n=1 Tax=Corynebacterium halotolerans TaxID=225326 RepID=UPI003CF334C5
MSTGLALFLLIVLLAGNAFFVAAEFAMVTARRDQIEPRAAAGSGAAKWALKGIEDVTTALAATQLGITACSLLIGAVGEPAIAHLIEVPLISMGVPEGLIHPIALVIALLIVTYFHMVLGEMVPKNISIAKPAESAMLLGPVLHVFVVVFRPLIWFMNHLANLVVRHLFRATPRDEVASTFTSEEVAGFVAESGREGLLDEDEIHLLQGALGFESLTATDVAIPAREVRTVPADATVAEVEAICADTGFSRFPVQQPDGALSGYVHVKDLLELASRERTAKIPAAEVHELIRVPADAKLRPVVSLMQRHNAHLALIEGEGNQVNQVAVIALEDVLEELVGEVTDATRG